MRNTQIATADTLAAEEVIFDYLAQNVHLDKMNTNYIMDTLPQEYFKESTAVKFWSTIKMPSDHEGMIIVILEIIALSIFLAIKVFYPFFRGVEYLVSTDGDAVFLTFLVWVTFLVTGLWGISAMVDKAFTLGNYPREEFAEKQTIEELLTTLNVGQKKYLKKKISAAKTKIIAAQKLEKEIAQNEKQEVLLKQYEYA